MSLEIKCLNCNNLIVANSMADAPKECEHCQEDLLWTESIQSETESNYEATKEGEIIGVRWQCQKNSGSFQVFKSNGKTQLIGRNYLGAEILNDIIFNNILIVSRKHCSIEFIENQVFIKDESSTNGTFRTVEKVNCSVKQQLRDNDIIWLGNEPFVISFDYNTTTEKKLSQNSKDEKYRCNGCGFEDIKLHPTCPNCSLFKGMISVISN